MKVRARIVPHQHIRQSHALRAFPIGPGIVADGKKLILASRNPPRHRVWRSISLAGTRYKLVELFFETPKAVKHVTS